MSKYRDMQLETTGQQMLTLCAAQFLSQRKSLMPLLKATTRLAAKLTDTPPEQKLPAIMDGIENVEAGYMIALAALAANDLLSFDAIVDCMSEVADITPAQAETFIADARELASEYPRTGEATASVAQAAIKGVAQ